MKFLIWLVTLFVAAVITTAASFSGISLGAIPTILIYGLAFWIARTLCRKHDEKNGTNVVPTAYVDVNRDKDSLKLGRDPITPYYTKKRYQNKDWATIETYLGSTLCGENGENLLFKYRATTTIGRSSTIVELIYIFDSFEKNGEKYAELYVCDEYDDETIVAPVGYRLVTELTVQEDCEAKTPTFSLSVLDEKPISQGSHEIRGSDVMLEQPDKTSSYCLSSSTDEPFVPYGNSDIFGRDMLKKEPLQEKKTEAPSQPSVACPSVEQVKEIRFCRKCGSRLMEGARFCSHCGTEVITR